MENRFVEAEHGWHRRRRSGNGVSGALSGGWVEATGASDRRLVILIENGGVDLGIPKLAEALLDALPGGDMIPASYRKKLVTYLGDKIRELTDNLIEGAELALNRYSSAKPKTYGDVIVLRNGTASYRDLKDALLTLSREKRIIDVLTLTHGDHEYIAVNGGIDGQKIRAMRTELGAPLHLRSVYMMNCVGSSLNQAWIDAGAKASSGSTKDNYLPEPTTFFFWRAWSEGKSFETAATSAYQKTVQMMNDVVRGFISALPIPGSSLLASRVRMESMQFVKDSAPVIQGDGSVAVGSDSLSFASTVTSAFATTVVPVRALQEGVGDPVGGTGELSAAARALLERWEPVQQGGEAALQALLARGQHAAEVLKETVKVPLRGQQSDALVSFIANVGEAAFRRSTLLKLLNSSDFAGAAAEIVKWVKARRGGEVVEDPALVERRRVEAELFRAGPSLSGGKSTLPHAYSYESASQVMTVGDARYSHAQTPAVAGIALADAIQIGLGAVAVVQSQYAASQGAFTLTYDKAQRLLTSEARAQMPGAQVAKQSYSRQLLLLSIPGRGEFAKADVIIEWEGNPYGEISTPVIRRKLSTSTEWSKSSANIVISKVDRIPLPNTDPRSWPISFSYEGTYDPAANGYWEFSGEFEVNAFGGLKFTRHEVVSRAFIEFAISKPPTAYVKKGPDVIVPVPEVPAEQLKYLKSKLP